MPTAECSGASTCISTKVSPNRVSEGPRSFPCSTARMTKPVATVNTVGAVPPVKSNAHHAMVSLGDARYNVPKTTARWDDRHRTIMVGGPGIVGMRSSLGHGGLVAVAGGLHLDLGSGSRQVELLFDQDRLHRLAPLDETFV